MAYDPQDMRVAAELLDSRVKLDEIAYDVADDANAVVLIAEWNEFRSLDLDGLKAR